MAVDRFSLGFKIRYPRILSQGLHEGLHHQHSVHPRELLCPFDRLDIIVEVFSAFVELGQICIRQVLDVFLHVLLRHFNER